MVPRGIPIVSLLLGGTALLAMAPFPGPAVWERCAVVAAVVVMAYAVILVSVRRVRRASPAARAVVTTAAMTLPALVVGFGVVPAVTDVSRNWLLGPVFILASTVVFRLVFAVGERISPKSMVNLVAGVVGVHGYLMAFPPIVVLDDQVWRAVGLAVVAGVALGAVAAWLLAGAQYYFP